MELDSSLQVSPDAIYQKKFDAFIAVSGYESRSSYLISKINIQAIPNKIVLAFNEKKDFLYREFNDQKYREADFTFVTGSSFDASIFSDILEELCDSIEKSTIDILVDYSSMPKVWYSELLNYFSSREDEPETVNLWFSYSPSEFTRSVSSSTNKYLDPVKPGIQSEKPVALILGLGYEKGRAEEFAKLFNAKVTFAFYANPSVDSRYVQEVLTNNQAVLKNISQEQIVSYPINDLNSVNESLTQLCIDLRINHQVFLVPVGPKPFTLMCFILSARYPDIKICRVSSIIPSNAADHRAAGELLVYRVTMVNEEVDY